MRVFRRLLPGIVRVAVVFGVSLPALASGEVAAVGISAIREAGGAYRIEVDYAVSWTADQGDFAYTLLLTQKRDGRTVAIPLSRTERILPLGRSAGASGDETSAAPCRYATGKDAPVHQGRREPLGGPDSGASRRKTVRSCSHVDSRVSDALRIASGDVITFAITPAPNLQGDDPSNNTLRITIE